LDSSRSGGGSRSWCGHAQTYPDQFSLSLVRTGASINWSGTSSLGSFASDAVTKVNFAQIAHETNGMFFGG